MALYSYWRSSAAYRVRIALNLKGLEHEIRPISLLRDGGEHRKASYLEINPQGMVPTLVDGDLTIGQSIAILEYLEEAYPERPLLPASPADCSRVRQLMNIVCCDIHPLNNLRVLQYLDTELNVDQVAKDAWYGRWIHAGFDAFEKMLVESGTYCAGDAPGLADACLVPQVYNARRFGVPLDAYPRIVEIADRCNALQEFIDASPEAHRLADEA
ncbi:MAG: maleylacetoacetate isomerase [Gammaproteobacteria bacterium]